MVINACNTICDSDCARVGGCQRFVYMVHVSMANAVHHADTKDADDRLDNRDADYRFEVR